MDRSNHQDPKLSKSLESHQSRPCSTLLPIVVCVVARGVEFHSEAGTRPSKDDDVKDVVYALRLTTLQK